MVLSLIRPESCTIVGCFIRTQGLAIIGNNFYPYLYSDARDPILRYMLTRSSSASIAIRCISSGPILSSTSSWLVLRSRSIAVAFATTRIGIRPRTTGHGSDYQLYWSVGTLPWILGLLFLGTACILELPVKRRKQNETICSFDKLFLWNLLINLFLCIYKYFMVGLPDHFLIIITIPMVFFGK